MISPQLLNAASTGPVFAFGCAEVFMLLMKAREITVLFKTFEQRTPTERIEVERGLGRALLLEAFVFVPASVLLVLVLIRPFVLMSSYGAAFRDDRFGSAAFGILGIISYQFPFAIMRRIATHIALSTLKTFAQLVLNPSDLPKAGPE